MKVKARQKIARRVGYAAGMRPLFSKIGNKETEVSSNAEPGGELLYKFTSLDNECKKIMEEAAGKLSPSMHSFNRVT
ncbi:MAG: hypothetical protein IRF6MM_05240 [Candidatus Midichloria mitochondrii]